jgi:FkbM family methyltransferase
MRVDLADWLGQYVFLTGTYEPQTAEVIALLVDPGDTVVDVGANAGFFTLLAASRVGPAGQVLAFEPVPAVWAALNLNVDLNGVRQVSLHRVALSDANGTLTMYEGPPSHRGVSSLRPLGDGFATHQVEVRCLDDWMHTLRRVKLIKIDVEGAEQHVVRGMRRLIERDAPFLVVEVTDAYLRKMGHSASMLFGSLAALGYRMFRITGSGLVPVDRPPLTWDAQFNALFCDEGRLPAILRHRVAA